VRVLDRVAQIIRGTEDETEHLWIALKGLRLDEGRISVELRDGIAGISDGSDFATDFARMVDANISEFDAICGDSEQMFRTIAQAPAEQREAMVFDSCQLERCGLVSRERVLRTNLGNSLLACALLDHLDRKGGAHEAEQRLLRAVAGRTGLDAVGPGRILELPQPHTGPTDVHIHEIGVRLVYPSAPEKQTWPPEELGLVFYKRTVGGTVFQLNYSPAMENPSDAPPLEVAAEGAATAIGLSDVSNTAETFLGQPARFLDGRLRDGGRYLSYTLILEGRVLGVACISEAPSDPRCDDFFASVRLEGEP
jgi:hypothetical protein